MANRIKLAGTTEKVFELGNTNKQIFDATGLTANRTWVLPDSNGTSGYALTTNGSGVLSWTAGGSTSPAGSNTEIQFNNSGAFGASSKLTYNSASDELVMGGPTAVQTLIIGTAGAVRLSSGGGVSGIAPVNLQINAGAAFIGSNQSGATVFYQGGSGEGTGAGGGAAFYGGSANGSGNGGLISLLGGNATGTGTGGNITLDAGLTTTGTYGGVIDFSTGVTSLTRRLRIDSAGSWGLGNSSDFGSSGDVLTSQGAGSPPIWAAAAGGASFPIGTIVNQPSAPSDGGTWFACDGSWLSQATYATLYSNIGQRFRNYEYIIGNNSLASNNLNIMWAGTRWLAFNTGASLTPKYSTDGLTWTNATSFSASSVINGGIYDNGVVIAQVSTGTTYRRSTDAGATWSNITVPFAAMQISGDGTGNMIGFLTSVATRTVGYSSNGGATWSQTSNAFPSFSGTYGTRSIVKTTNGWFMSVNTNNATAIPKNYYTTDITGQTGWTDVTNPIATGTITSNGSKIAGWQSGNAFIIENDGVDKKITNVPGAQSNASPIVTAGGFCFLPNPINSVVFSENGSTFNLTTVKNAPIGGSTSQNIVTPPNWGTNSDDTTGSMAFAMTYNTSSALIAPRDDITTKFALPERELSWIKAL